MDEFKKQGVLFAIVQSQDVDLAEQALQELGADVYRLPSVGGFLGRRNVTLMIKNIPSKQDDMIKILENTCRQRIEYIAIPLESVSPPLPTPTPINVGGATVFGVNIERYEEL